MAAVGCRLDHHRLSRAIAFCSSEQAIDKAVRFVFRDCDPKKAPLLQPRKGMEYKSLALLAEFLNHGKKKTSLDFLIPVIGSVEKRATAARVWGSCGRGENRRSSHSNPAGDGERNLLVLIPRIRGTAAGSGD
ncbi:hypothetical protein OPV22_022808 [Ensete ventricosum]|uniref:Uncharacterized protein n=1 Tax=Ensete ventricosum TaxID=4639 RepID=A0AAV8QKI4_ENSVE|nr:hypothetical protein OPV22_022808 [Ensete ventricosum]